VYLYVGNEPPALVPDSSIRPAEEVPSATDSAAGDAAERLAHTVDTSIERHVDHVLDGKQGESLAVSDDGDG